MQNALKYYNNSIIYNKPSSLLLKFFAFKYNEELNGNIAIDLGCGAGNDTLFLLEKGFNVTAIDNHPQVKDILKNKKNDYNNLNIIINDYTKETLSNADLIFSNFSLFFIKNNFDKFMKKILLNVNYNGFFVANFLGKEDDWANINTAVEKDKLLSYFDDFEIKYFSEEKYYKDSLNQKNKFWHLYTIMAKKK